MQVQQFKLTFSKNGRHIATKTISAENESAAFRKADAILKVSTAYDDWQPSKTMGKNVRNRQKSNI